MRWFIIFLLVANIILFFWVQQQSRPMIGATDLPPPEIGRLRLMNEVDDEAAADEGQGMPLSQQPGPTVAQQEAAALPRPTDGGSMPSGESLPAPAVPPLPATPPAVPEAEPDVLASAVVAPLQQALPADQTGAALSTETAMRRPTRLETPAPQAAARAPAVSAADQIGAGPSAEQAMPSPPQLEVPEVSAAAPPLGEVGEPAPTTPLPVCARVGPFDPKDADTLIANLPAHIRLVSDTSEEYAKFEGYYVLIPPLPTRAAGIRTLKELEDAGITDTWLFRAGEFRNAISLGLFRREAGARRHAGDVSKKGFTTEVRERTVLRERRWLQLRNAHGGDPLGGMPLPDGTGVTPQDCP